MRSVPARAICGDVGTPWDARDRKQADEIGQSAYGLRDRQAEWKETWDQRRSKRSSLAAALLASKKTPVGRRVAEDGLTSSAFLTWLTPGAAEGLRLAVL